MAQKVRVAELSAKGTSKYAQKLYEEAADFYAEASELQAELNGEMNPLNADILFLYGRALFQVGQKKSGILGDGAAKKEKKKPKNTNGAKKQAVKEDKSDKLEKVIEEGVTEVAENASTIALLKEGEETAMFNFTGDENFEDSDDEEDQGEEGEEEEEDDMATAYEVLDLARLLFLTKLHLEQGPAKGPVDSLISTPAAKPIDSPATQHIMERDLLIKRLQSLEEAEDQETNDSPDVRHLKERLADTHALLGEISMENEK